MQDAKTIRVSAPAKLNLYLHVTGKRDDGYHLLDSLVAFVHGVEDFITITPSTSGTYELKITGDGAQWLDGSQDNLVTRAANAYAKAAGKDISSIKINLEKNIPTGAGLGGGSADAAATIRALEEYFGHALPVDTRDPLLVALGADVPVCYHSAESRFQGIGDIITPAPILPSLPIILVWPRQHNATPDVFREYKGPFGADASLPNAFPTSAALIGFLKTTNNDLAAAAETLCPEIAIVREEIEDTNGCTLARMTGSGSCVFGIYKEESERDQAARELSALNPSWWVKTGAL